MLDVVSAIPRFTMFGANWKNNEPLGEADLSPEQVRADYCFDLNANLDFSPLEKTVVVFPPDIHVVELSQLLSPRFEVGVQNVYKGGAFTGEISPEIARASGATWTLVGHSERLDLGESDKLINERLKIALSGGMNAILCVGETDREREEGFTEATIFGQLTKRLDGVKFILNDPYRLVIAYEPRWAIGTGKTCPPQEADNVHWFIYNRLASGILSESSADRMSVIYGGSVKPDNVEKYMDKPHIFGALVGGAALNSKQFIAISNTSKP